MAVKNINENEFEAEVIQSKQLVLIDFWAEWCGPCRMVSPILEEVAEEKKDEIKLVKINVDQNQNIAFQYGIQSIPTVLAFYDGKLVARVIGARTKDLYLQMISEIQNKLKDNSK